MKKIIIALGLFIGIGVLNIVFADETLSIKDLKKMNIQANAPVKKSDLESARLIMLKIQEKTMEGVNNGKGPFYAEIYDEQGNLVVSSSNSVVEDQCSLYHAEINTLKKAHEKIFQL